MHVQDWLVVEMWETRRAANRKGKEGGGEEKKKEGGGLLTPTAKYNVRAIEEKYVPVNGKRSVESRCFTVSRTLAG